MEAAERRVTAEKLYINWFRKNGKVPVECRKRKQKRSGWGMITVLLAIRL